MLQLVTETVGCGFVCLFFDKYNKLTYVIGEQVTDTNKLPRKCNKTQTVADPEGGDDCPLRLENIRFLLFNVPILTQSPPPPMKVGERAASPLFLVRPLADLKRPELIKELGVKCVTFLHSTEIWLLARKPPVTSRATARAP